jgi:hypothetical protein
LVHRPPLINAANYACNALPFTSCHVAVVTVLLLGDEGKRSITGINQTGMTAKGTTPATAAGTHASGPSCRQESSIGERCRVARRAAQETSALKSFDHACTSRTAAPRTGSPPPRRRGCSCRPPRAPGAPAPVARGVRTPPPEISIFFLLAQIVYESVIPCDGG